MQKVFFFIMLVPFLTLIAYTCMYSFDYKAVGVTIFFALSGLFNNWVIQKASESKSSAGFLNWVYGGIGFKMISVVGLAFYFIYFAHAPTSLIFLIIVNYFLYTTWQLITQKK